MSAKEMFEQLGYEQKTDTMGMYYYRFSSKYEKDNYSGHDWENTIRFDSYKKIYIVINILVYNYYKP